MSRTEANDRLAALRAMPYADYLLSPEWRERRKQALDWARNACQLCNSPQEPLHVHHRTYDRLGAELPADLVVLCEDCHDKHHGKGINPDTFQKWATDAILTLCCETTTSKMVTRLMSYHDRTDPGWLAFSQKMNDEENK